MKSARAGSRSQRREQLLHDPRHDSYKAKASCPTDALPGVRRRVPEGTLDLERRATRLRARAALPGLPADPRRLPAGYVSLAGDYLAGHREEILNIVRNCEAVEKAGHPLQRIIAIRTWRAGSWSRPPTPMSRGASPRRP